MTTSSPSFSSPRARKAPQPPADITIVEVSCSADQARAAVDTVAAVAPETSAILFGGDRWTDCDLVAVAILPDGTPVGLATLALRGHHVNNEPEIVGVWVVPERRRQGIGQALVLHLIQTSLNQTGQTPLMVAVTEDGDALVQALMRCDAAIRRPDTSKTGASRVRLR